MQAILSRWVSRMRAEIISIGTELVSGQSLDTNSRWLSQELSALGIPVAFHTTLGDVLEDHTGVFRTPCARADLVVMTGGLGADNRMTSTPRRHGRVRAECSPGGRPRISGGDRRDVRPPQSGDGGAKPRAGALSPRS